MALDGFVWMNRRLDGIESRNLFSHDPCNMHLVTLYICNIE